MKFKFESDYLNIYFQSEAKLLESMILEKNRRKMFEGIIVAPLDMIIKEGEVSVSQTDFKALLWICIICFRFPTKFLRHFDTKIFHIFNYVFNYKTMNRTNCLRGDTVAEAISL